MDDKSFLLLRWHVKPEFIYDGVPICPLCIRRLALGAEDEPAIFRLTFLLRFRSACHLEMVEYQTKNHPFRSVKLFHANFPWKVNDEANPVIKTCLDNICHLAKL